MQTNMEKQSLILIPKTEIYLQYMIELIQKLPRIEKFNIGNEYKTSLYDMLRNILYIQKIEEKSKLYYLNKVDSELNVQRILLRIMYKNCYIDKHKFEVAIGHITEVGKLLGGIIKYYAKNHKK